MATRPKLEPGPDHPITVAPTGTRVRVLVGDHVLVDTDRALSLRESNYPAVQYIPLEDVDTSRLVRTTTETYCPYKGDASYYSITDSAGNIADAVWEYRTPYDAVADIAGHVAFYPNKVTVAVG